MQVLRTICLECRFLPKSLCAVFESIRYRWRYSVLCFTSPCNTRSSASICPSFPPHSEPPSTRDWFLGHPGSRAEPIPFQRASKCTGSRSYRRSSGLGQLWQNPYPAGGFPTSTLGRGLRHRPRISLRNKSSTKPRRGPCAVLCSRTTAYTSGHHSACTRTGVPTATL